MAIGIVMTGLNLAQKALKGSNNAKGNLFQGMGGKFAKIKDGIKDKVGDFLDKEDKSQKNVTTTPETETDMELRGRREREAEEKRKEEERLAAEAAKKNKTMMYAVLAGAALLFMMKKKR